MTYAITIEPYDDAQLSHLKTLFASYFKPDDRLLTESYSQWLYGANPIGRARIVAVVEDGRWIGFMAMIPVDLVKGEERRAAYYVVNVLVHPEHHGKNLFRQMIVAAKELAMAEDATLIGHPNEMALPFWKRARMQFQESLIPTLTLPTWHGLGLKVRPIKTLDQLQAVMSALPQRLVRMDRWNVALSAPYLDWRYLQHPTNRYYLQSIQLDGAVAGLQIVKRIRWGVNMLIDQFVIERHRNAATERLPWPTIAFKPETSIRTGCGLVWRLPLKKQIDFFCTHFQRPFEAGDLTGLGLSASDF